MLLVSMSGIVEENAVELFHHYGFNLPSSFLCKISTPFKENNSVAVFQFTFHIFVPLAHLWFIRLQGYFSILRARRCSDLYLLIRPPRRVLVFGREIIDISGFIRSPPKSAVYIAHSLPLGGVGRDFTFI